MKKRWKIFWAVCAVTAGIGLVCCIAALALGVSVEMLADRFPNGIGLVAGRDTLESDTETYEGVRKIDMKLSAGDVEVLPGDGQEVVVETENISRRLNFSASMEGDELKITSRKWALFAERLGRGKIYIYLPREQMLEEISLDVGAGNLTVENLRADSFSLDVGAGEGLVESFTAREADFSCGTGTINIRGEASQKLDIDCGVGDIEYTAYGNEGDYDFNIDCGVGDVTVGERSYSGLGRSNHVNNGTGRQINIDCGVGSVCVLFDSAMQTGMSRTAAWRGIAF